MSLATLGIDAYQLTTLAAHADAERLGQRISAAFFFRELPPRRGYVVFAGLRALLEHAAQLRFEADELALLRAHPTLGPALTARPALEAALEALDGFEGEIDALPEGTLAFAGPASRTDGTPAQVRGAPLHLYTPLLQVRTDLVRAKLIETPWLGLVNHQSMVATKAARIVDAAAGRPVFEFGARRTDPRAAVEAAWAAHLGGCAATSNLAAFARHGIPAEGTMDHFFVQAAERDDVDLGASEATAFQGLFSAFGAGATLLVDTYDTEAGIRRAVAATNGRLGAIRIDSSVTPEAVRRARRLLVELGAPQAKIIVSDRLDEDRVAELASLVDGFGIGEAITCVPDAAGGVGAVAKLVVNGYGRVTMKVARGSAKLTLPGELQVYRFGDHDVVALAEEPPPGGRALLQPAWRGRSAVNPSTLSEGRARVRTELDALPARLRAPSPSGPPYRLVASDALVRRIEARVDLVAEARP